jgi:hypothetical protein
MMELVGEVDWHLQQVQLKQLVAQ